MVFVLRRFLIAFAIVLFKDENPFYRLTLVEFFLFTGLMYTILAWPFKHVLDNIVEIWLDGFGMFVFALMMIRDRLLFEESPLADFVDRAFDPVLVYATCASIILVSLVLIFFNFIRMLRGLKSLTRRARVRGHRAQRNAEFASSGNNMTETKQNLRE